MIGEITGGMDFAINTLKKTGLDAALGINNIPEAMENVAKGYEAPEAYFDIFSNSEILGDEENLWYKDKIVTMFGDHDMVSQDGEIKQRFSADESSKSLLLNCLFLNVFTSGIPCIYYGTEQGFDGMDHLISISERICLEKNLVLLELKIDIFSIIIHRFMLNCQRS